MTVKPNRTLRSAFALVQDDPLTAVDIATGIILAPSATTAERAEARWARGLARRERGDLQAGAEDLFEARQEAVAAGDEVLAARIDTSLALVALYTGSADGALEILAGAAPHLSGADLARLENQRGLIRHRSGDLAAATADYRAALHRLRQHPDAAAEVFVLTNLGLLHAQQGNLPGAERSLAAAVALAESEGLRYLAAANRHNLGYARAQAGQLSAAMDDMAGAQELLAGLDRPEVLAVVQSDLAELLLQSNLLHEAVTTADRALAGVRQQGNETDIADAALLAARCRLAAGRIEGAREAAAESVASLRRQHRRAWAALAEFVLDEIDAVGRSDVALAEDFADLAGRLDQHGWSGQAVAARVDGARAFLACGEPERAARLLDRLRDIATRPAGERAAIHLARGLLAESRGDRRGARRAVRTGLRVVGENQATLGALEFRSFAAGHGAQLVDIGVRLAVSDRRPRAFLDHLESTRQTLWVAPRPTPPDDDVLADLLSQLRIVTTDLRAAVGVGADADALRRRQLALERSISTHTRRSRGEGGGRTVSIAEAIATLGDHALVEYAILGGRIHAVSVVGGRAQLHDLGPEAGVADDIEACTFALHRLSRNQASQASRDAARASLDEVGRRLVVRLVPVRVVRSSRPLVVVPAGPLHGLAWGALPEFRGRAVSVSPSLVGWTVARRRGGSSPTRVLLAAGPDLPGARAEIDAVAAGHRRPTILTGVGATADRTLTELARSDLAHLACHGAFRQDNPLFSTLSMTDGPLTVHDLDRCARLPSCVVLSACSVGTSAVLRGGTLLGLASALMTFGASSVVAP
ncbi:MAG: CHAT domain-containing protein, partial [Acidimicrobiia bacterium]|nr:CHAT domain-containing protein [Acidimicrobiia bacterium]